MTITVGTDTYITILEADAYIELRYTSTDAQRVAWEDLDDGDKEIHLRNSTAAIEQLKFPGQKNDPDQSLSFPRNIPGAWPLRRNPGVLTTSTMYDPGIYSLLPTYAYDPSSINVWIIIDDVPEDIKSAQAEEALEMASPGDDTQLYNIARNGLKSFSISGGISESYRDAPSRSQNMPETVLRSTKAQQMVILYTGGQFRVI